MHPNAALARIRELNAEILRRIGDNTEGSATKDFHITQLAAELVELIEGLDRWLSAACFLPDAWKEAR